MPLPDPWEVAVPSIADGTLLESRVYLGPAVRDAAAASPEQRKAAVMAHPYGPLGGSFDDPVVLSVAEELLRAGFHAVVTFNFRKRTSWTSKPEIKDYTSVACFLMHFLLECGFSALDIVLGGYSYGSMVASQVAPMQDLLREHLGTETSAVVSLAKKYAAKLSRSDAPVANSTAPLIETRYLLISPVLPPVSMLLTCSVKAKDYKKLESNNTLVVFGTADNFTSGTKISRWANGLGAHSEEVVGAGHFWFEESAAQRLKQAVGKWARNNSDVIDQIAT